MAVLLGVAGHSGAGKTTAVQYLAELGFAQALYAGDAVLDEVRSRGLPVTPENERNVRLELRETRGAAVLAELLLPRIHQLASSGISVLVDAIFTLQELDIYKSASVGHVVLLAIDASFEIRASRLEKRACRPSTYLELQTRDAIELNVLRTDNVFAQANGLITNEKGIDEFKFGLEEFWRGQCR